MIIYITNISLSMPNAIIAIKILLIIWTYLMIIKAFLTKYNFDIDVLSPNNTRILLSLGINILKTILTLMLAIKNVFLKNLSLLNLFFI